MKSLEFAVQCPKCGFWRSVSTDNLSSAQFTCFRSSCGKTSKIRNMKGWNVNHRMPQKGQEVSVLVALLNQREN
jgi:hypothetical protein